MYKLPSVFAHIQIYHTHPARLYDEQIDRFQSLGADPVICETLDIGGEVDVLYTDFTKTFERINHFLLLEKLLTLLHPLF